MCIQKAARIISPQTHASTEDRYRWSEMAFPELLVLDVKLYKYTASDSATQDRATGAVGPVLTPPTTPVAVANIQSFNISCTISSRRAVNSGEAKSSTWSIVFLHSHS